MFIYLDRSYRHPALRIFIIFLAQLCRRAFPISGLIILSFAKIYQYRRINVVIIHTICKSNQIYLLIIHISAVKVIILWSFAICRIIKFVWRLFIATIDNSHQQISTPAVKCLFCNYPSSICSGSSSTMLNGSTNHREISQHLSCRVILIIQHLTSHNESN